MDYTTFSDLRCLNIAYRKVTLSWVVFLLDFSGAFIVTRSLFLGYQANSKGEEGGVTVWAASNAINCFPLFRLSLKFLGSVFLPQEAYTPFLRHGKVKRELQHSFDLQLGLG